MPHSFAPAAGMAARSNPRIILERPELAALLGAITAEWGNIDTLYLAIFDLVTFAEPMQGGYASSKISNAVFEQSFSSFKTKSEVIARVIKLRLGLALAEEFETISQRITRNARSRNKLVHCTWHLCDDYPEDLLQVGDPNWTRFTKRDFTETLDLAVELRNLLHDYLIKASHAPRIDG